MNRYKCPACGRNQYTSADTAEGCIYCGNKELKKMEILEPKEGEGMREIKFRGKRLDNGEWVYGFLIQYLSRVFLQHGWFICNFIGDAYQYEVDPSTVGQFTGLKDKNGKEIYEGDIVLATLKFFNINNEKCKVIFHNGSFGVQYGFSTDYFKTLSAWDEVEVIDNIYDNPELLKEDRDD